MIYLIVVLLIIGSVPVAFADNHPVSWDHFQEWQKWAFDMQAYYEDIVSVLQDRITELQSEITQLQSNMTKLQSKAAGLETENTKLADSLKATKNHQTKYDDGVLELQNTITNLQAKNKALSSTSDTAQSRHNSLLDQIAVLESKSTHESMTIKTDKRGYLAGEIIKVRGHIDPDILYKLSSDHPEYFSYMDWQKKYKYDLDSIDFDILSDQESFFGTSCHRYSQYDLSQEHEIREYNYWSSDRLDYPQGECFDDNGNFEFNVRIGINTPTGDYIIRMMLETNSHEVTNTYSHIFTIS